MNPKLIPLGRSELETAVEVLRRAFADDPMVQYVFSASNTSFEKSGEALFTFSCEVRLLLEWPLLGVMDEEDVLVGVAGLSLPGEPEWPPALHEVYEHFKTTVGPESASRLEAYAELTDTNRPGEPHFQLGLMGVVPKAQGKGYGTLMLGELHRLSEQDPGSTGVWLDTETRENVAFYEHHGYQVMAHSTLDALDIWGMFRPNQG